MPRSCGLDLHFVLTLQQIVLSKNLLADCFLFCVVLTLQQIVLSKNGRRRKHGACAVLTLQQIVLSKNQARNPPQRTFGFDFTTNCSF